MNLTPEYLKEVWDKQNGICPYTQIKMKLEKEGELNKPHSASVDRIDSSKGYEVGNVEFVCYFVNLGKSNFSKSEVSKFLKEIKQ